MAVNGPNSLQVDLLKHCVLMLEAIDARGAALDDYAIVATDAGGGEVVRATGATKVSGPRVHLLQWLLGRPYGALNCSGGTLPDLRPMAATVFANHPPFHPLKVRNPT